MTLTAVGVDQFGNATPTTAIWTVTPGTLGSLTPASGPTTTFTAGTAPGSGQLTATVSTPAGPLSASVR